MFFFHQRGWRIWVGLLLCGLCGLIIFSSFGLFARPTSSIPRTVPVAVAAAAGIGGVCLLGGPAAALVAGAGLSLAGCGGGGGGGDQNLGEPPEPPSALP